MPFNYDIMYLHYIINICMHHIGNKLLHIIDGISIFNNKTKYKIVPIYNNIVVTTVDVVHMYCYYTHVQYLMRHY